MNHLLHDYFSRENQRAQHIILPRLDCPGADTYMKPR